ncbi:SDR family oxidoreductase [Aestuariispira insulae]|uniref:Short-subunit dehydrogenase n=1 Tax=Aestuariispira insulae TaxID=1461337 RepID=A0A3D9H9C5_9PROT|nr:SDR family oxidoreductase [Aestuariispira insulae]RED45771.1 short-subunit dehydrogenase [Aestuariispira insulae]
MESLRPGFTVIVFGATGGIGRALTRQIEQMENCAQCFALSRTGSPAIDFSDEDTLAEAAAFIQSRQGEIDLMIDATGVLTIKGARPEKTIRQIDPVRMAEAFLVNSIGPALLLKHFSPLLPRGRKSIFASLSARVGSITDNASGGWIGYRASKAALNQIIHTAAIELSMKKTGSLVVALQPGTVDTPLSQPYRGRHATLSPDEAAKRLLAVIDGLSPEESGGFFDHKGQRVPW